MAQGKLKIKTKLPTNVKTGQSAGSVKKNAGKLKKGRRVITPKDNKFIEFEKTKKILTKLSEKNILKSAVNKVEACQRVTLSTLKFD